MNGYLVIQRLLTKVLGFSVFAMQIRKIIIENTNVKLAVCRLVGLKQKV